jgi:nitrate/nitrite transporter NarK
METNKTTAVPEVGALVRKVGGEIAYRVTSSRATGCNVEATVTECTPVAGRAARPLHYSEKRASLALSNGILIDDRWNAWEVIS